MAEQSDHDLLVEIRQDVRYIRETLSDHEDRIRCIEQQQNRWLGRDGAIAAFISATVALAVAIFTRIFGGGAS